MGNFVASGVIEAVSAGNAPGTDVVLRTGGLPAVEDGASSSMGTGKGVGIAGLAGLMTVMANTPSKIIMTAIARAVLKSKDKVNSWAFNLLDET